MDTTDVVVKLVTAGKSLGAIFAIVDERPIEMDVFNMLSQIVSVLSSFATQCASVKLLTILSSCVVNVAVQLLVLILACKQLVSNYHSKQQVLIQRINLKIYLTICVTLYVCKAGFLWKRSFHKICTCV